MIIADVSGIERDEMMQELDTLVSRIEHQAPTVARCLKRIGVSVYLSTLVSPSSPEDTDDVPNGIQCLPIQTGQLSG